MDYGGQGTSPLVDFEEYGYEVMDATGGPFSGSLSMPPGGNPYYPDNRGQ